MSADHNVADMLWDSITINAAPPADSEAFAEILLSFQSCCLPAEPEPVAVAEAAEENGLVAAVVGLEEAAGEELAAAAAVEELRSGAPSSPVVVGAGLELAVVEQQNAVGVDEQAPPAGSSRKGRKRKTEEEKEEFWNKAPVWLPEGFTFEVRKRKDGARDRYYYDPKTGNRFRSRKEIERFTTMGEDRGKTKYKMTESNVIHTPSPSSEHLKKDVSGLDVACSANQYPRGTLPGPAWDLNTAYIEINCGMQRNWQPEGGATMNGQYETEATTVMQQSVPSEIAGLRTIFDLETDKASERTKQSEREREEKGSRNSKSEIKANNANWTERTKQYEREGEEKGSQKSKSEIKANNAKQMEGSKINQLSDLGKVSGGVQPSQTERNVKRRKRSACLSISGRKASSSGSKRDLKVDRNILIQVGREVSERARLACMGIHS